MPFNAAECEDKMDEKTASKRRDWVKNAAIIFLAVMLVLTFFSNTIMNYSLPEVATQYVQRGTITAKVRGTGTVEATDPYNVVVKESRVISSVAVKQGDTVEKDQVIYYLEDAESDELKKAEDELGDDGRILVRMSGTEPLIRVMAEAVTDETCRLHVENIIEVIRQEGLEE